MIRKRLNYSPYCLCKFRFFTLLGFMAVCLTEAHVALAEKQIGECKHKGVSVLNSNQIELTTVCQAMNDIAEYFQSIGFATTLEGTLIFANRAGNGGFTHGYFDSKQSQIVVYRTSNFSPWGIPWTSRLAGSFLRHELVHMMIWKVLGEDPARLRQEWHEFIAYAIQFDLMDPQLRSDILASMVHIQPFETYLEINEFSSRMKPNQFAVAAYKTYLAKGGREFVKQLLHGEIVPAPFSYPFPVGPTQ